MKYRLYTILLRFLRGAVLIKRGFVGIWLFLLPVGKKVNGWYSQSLGFYFYKIYFFTKRRIQKMFAPWERDIVFVLGKRSTLQVILFIVAFVLMSPYTKLFAKTDAVFPGQNTLLYKLVGQGEQDFQLEEVVAGTPAKNTELPSWSDGSMAYAPQTDTDIGIQEPQDITSIGAGGSALTKPTIIGGIPISPEETKPKPQGPRSGIVQHTVQAGETIASIARDYGIDVITVLSANNLTTRSYIRPGDSLKILPEAGVIHKVQKGDTIGKIAAKYGADVADIISANKLRPNGTDLVIGEEITVPGGTKPKAQAVQIVKEQQERETSPLKIIAAPQPSVGTPAGSGYVWPAGVRRITQYFGFRHTGDDIAGPIGTPLYAAKAGVVIRSQCGWNGGYGCHIIIDHGGGVTTLYGHASQLFVEVGEHVSQGQNIGLMGSTGHSTGPHLHFEVRIGSTRVNPLKYIR